MFQPLSTGITFALTDKAPGDKIPLILRYKDLRKAARDTGAFSSDTPCRVPIPAEEDVRSVRQLPLEVDPPEHTEYRRIVEPFFKRASQPDYIAKISASSSRKPKTPHARSSATPKRCRSPRLIRP